VAAARSARQRAGGALIALAAALAILGASVAPFLTPAWVSFEQGRAGSAALTGFSAAQLSEATNRILHDLVLGGDFRFKVAPRDKFSSPPKGGNGIPAPPVLNEREIAHMESVRGVFAGFALLVAASVVLLVVTARRSRDAEARRDWWRSVRRGATWLAVSVAVAGVISVVAFDAAFEVFHGIFFPAGSYSFDPATDRLVQLFPETFWSESTIAVGLLALLLSLGTWAFATARLRTSSGLANPAPVSS
jgi:integral membrane protein (TIGR01906 family)